MSDDLHQLTGAYAADALDDAERAAFVSHLRHCASCADEAHELHATTSRLAALTDEIPPPRVKTDLMARLDGVRQLPPVVSPIARAPRRSAKPAVRLALVAAAVALMTTLGATWTALQFRDDARRQEALTQVLAAPDARTVAGTGAWAGSKVVVSRTRGEAVLLATGIPAPAEGKTYEAWFIDEGAPPRPAGTFEPGDDGVRRIVDGDLGRASVVAITVEPDGGSTAPTSDPVAVFTLPQA